MWSFLFIFDHKIHPLSLAYVSIYQRPPVTLQELWAGSLLLRMTLVICVLGELCKSWDISCVIRRSDIKKELDTSTDVTL
jgi:hypothetical protein